MRLARNHCSKCRQELIDLALANEKTALPAHPRSHELEASKSAKKHAATQQKLRRTAAARDVKLYQCFIDHGANLPPLATPTSTQSNKISTDALLTSKQERALFRELQRRGAFQYPGMKDGFRDHNGRPLPDEKKYAIIKDQGCKWNVDKGWIKKNGRRVSFVRRAKKAEAGKEEGETPAKRWRAKQLVSGRKMPPRMDRGKFTLERIEEVEEVEEKELVEESWSFKNFLVPAALGSTYLETHGAHSAYGWASTASTSLGCMSGYLHTFQSIAIRDFDVAPHPLQSLSESIQRVRLGGEDPRFRKASLVKEGGSGSKGRGNMLARVVRTIVR